MAKIKQTREEALTFHMEPRPGKFEIAPSVPMTTQRDLSLAYSPGVAVPCEEIAQAPETMSPDRLRLADFLPGSHHLRHKSHGNGGDDTDLVQEGRCELQQPVVIHADVKGGKNQQHSEKFEAND